VRKELFIIFLLLLSFLFISAAEDFGVSEKGVKYDKAIVSNFNKNISNNKSLEFIPVIIKIKDTSNIFITKNDSIEIQNTKDKRRKEILDDISNSVLSSLSKENFQLEGMFSLGNGFYGEVNRKGFEELLGDNRIEKIYDNSFKGHVHLVQSGPLIGADIAHSNGYDGTGGTICVIDTGVDYTRTAFGSCTQQNFLAGTCDKVPAGYDYANGDSNPLDDDGHGTNVAGIIASEDVYWTGIANGSRIVALKACDEN